MRHPGTTLKLLLEQLQRYIVGFSVNFDITAREIANKASHAQSLRNSLRKISIADTLNSSTNKISLPPHHD